MATVASLYMVEAIKLTFAFFQFTPSGLLYKLYPVTSDVVEAFQFTSTT